MNSTAFLWIHENSYDFLRINNDSYELLAHQPHLAMRQPQRRVERWGDMVQPDAICPTAPRHAPIRASRAIQWGIARRVAGQRPIGFGLAAWQATVLWPLALLDLSNSVPQAPLRTCKRQDRWWERCRRCSPRWAAAAPSRSATTDVEGHRRWRHRMICDNQTVTSTSPRACSTAATCFARHQRLRWAWATPCVWRVPLTNHMINAPLVVHEATAFHASGIRHVAKLKLQTKQKKWALKKQLQIKSS